VSDDETEGGVTVPGASKTNVVDGVGGPTKHDPSLQL
jgi:hypothetical protein